eukprot:9328571-Ditylum_brightwellii.AAC.1
MEAPNMGFAKEVDFDEDLMEEFSGVKLGDIFHKDDQPNDGKDLNFHPWSDSQNAFAINEESEYIGGSDSEIVRITGRENQQVEYDYTVIGKGEIPFNVKMPQLKKRLLPDVVE